MISTVNIKGKVVDVDTGREVPHVYRLNLIEGYLEAWRTDANGRIRVNEKGEKLFYAAKGNFRLIPIKPTNVKRVEMGAPKCVKCSNPLTLPGDDLCPKCRFADRGITKLNVPILSDRCSCGKVAVWAVSDEVVVTPVRVGNKLYGRGATVGRRFYCDFHYKSPRLLDDKGEIVSEFETSVRPN